MVVIAASVLTSDGKVLVSRQFVDITKSRIEGLLAAFSKLLSPDSTHTYVENNHVRYVYQRIQEEIFLVLVTNKSSNIVEDLETLHLLAKVVPDYCDGLVEERSVLRNAFDLIFAFDEAVSRGYREKVTLAQIRTYTEMDSQEERIHDMIEKNKEREAAEEMKRRMKEVERERKEREKMGLSSFAGPGSRGGGSMSSLSSMSSMSSGGGYSEPRTSSSPIAKSAAPAPSARPARSGMKLGSKANAPTSFMEQLAKEGEVTSAPPQMSASGVARSAPVPEVPVVRDPIEVAITEKMQVAFDREGVLTQFVIDGELNVNVTAENAVKNRILLSNHSALQFRTHPNINKQLFMEKNIIALKDDQTAYRLNTPTAVLKWRHQSDREDELPVTVHCWPSVSGDGSVIANVDYEAAPGVEVVDFSVTIPIVGKSAPIVNTNDGSHHFDSKSNTLTWSIPVIGADNRRGEMSMEVAQWDRNSNDTNWLFPIVVHFTGRTTFAQLNVEAAKIITGESPSVRAIKELRVEKYVIGDGR